MYPQDSTLRHGRIVSVRTLERCQRVDLSSCGRVSFLGLESELLHLLRELLALSLLSFTAFNACSPSILESCILLASDWRKYTKNREAHVPWFHTPGIESEISISWKRTSLLQSTQSSPFCGCVAACLLPFNSMGKW
jgi:hypothetical protein